MYILIIYSCRRSFISIFISKNMLHESSYSVQNRLVVITYHVYAFELIYIIIINSKISHFCE